MLVAIKANPNYRQRLIAQLRQPRRIAYVRSKNIDIEAWQHGNRRQRRIAEAIKRKKEVTT